MLQIHKGFSQISFKMRDAMIKAQETKRRQLLKEDKMQEYEKCISESETNFKMKMMAVQQHVLG